jgi:hypothetical protein
MTLDTAEDPPSTALAADAFLYYYALVENLAQVTRYVTTGVGSNPPAPFNSFSHARKLADATDTFVTINNDTVYSMAMLDLSVGPLRLDVPATGDRYHVLQFVDAWTNNIAYIGTRATGNEAGTFHIVPPGWTGAVPDGPRVDASTTIVSIVGRFACAGPDDIEHVIALQDQLSLRPIDPDAGEPAGIPDIDGVSDELAFFERARVLSQRFPEVPEDAEYAARFAPLGLHDPTSPYVDADPALRETLVAGVAAGQEKMDSISRHTDMPVVNGWTVGMHIFDYNLHALGLGTIDEAAWKTTAPPDVRFALRAVADRLGLWGNNGYEAVYCQAFTDIDGQPLTGDHTYTMTFPEPPPVGAFWSITMYDIPNYFLVDNPIGRFSIGDRTPGIRHADDGSLTITIGNLEPSDPVARANWLPAPDAMFRLVFRLYIPGRPIIDGTYSVPPILRQ